MSRHVHTDLALELRESVKKSVDGLVFYTEEPQEGVKITRVHIQSAEAAQIMGKAQGQYVTLEAPGLYARDPLLEETVSHLMARELCRILPQPADNAPVLVVGLGNDQVTPDALGPKTVGRLMVTRHLLELIPQAMDERVRSVCTIAPGVLGETGIETVEVVRGVIDRVHPSAVVAVDALASRDSRRIASTIQISDAGLQPGSGVGNRRLALNQEVLGCPVIATTATSADGLKAVVEAAAAASGKTQSAPYHQGNVDLTDKAAVEVADRKRFEFVNGIVKSVENRKVLTKDKNVGDKIDAVLTNK